MNKPMHNQRDYGLLVDVQYAIRQLRDYREVQRALDALERVEEALLRQPEPEEDEDSDPCDGSGVHDDNPQTTPDNKPFSLPHASLDYPF